MTKQDKIKKVMKEFKNGTLKTVDGKVVKDRKQALAIAMSESEDYTEKADLISQIDIDSTSDALDILKSAGEEDLFEKAKHQDGDMHPNGKWVWVASANGGKGDWRTHGGRAHSKAGAAGGSSTTGSTTSGASSATSKPKTSKSTSTSLNIDNVKLDDLSDGSVINITVAQTGNPAIKFTKKNGKWYSENSMTRGEVSISESHVLSILSQYNRGAYRIDFSGAKEKPKSQRKLTTKQQTIVDNFMDKVKTSDSLYSDPSKVTLRKTPKGNWYVKYDGHQVATIAPLGLTEKIAEAAGMKIDREPSSYQSSKTTVQPATTQPKTKTTSSATQSNKKSISNGIERYEVGQKVIFSAQSKSLGGRKKVFGTIVDITDDKKAKIRMKDTGKIFTVGVKNLGRKVDKFLTPDKSDPANKTEQKKLRPVGTGTLGPTRRTKEEQEKIDKKKQSTPKKENSIEDIVLDWGKYPEKIDYVDKNMISVIKDKYVKSLNEGHKSSFSDICYEHLVSGGMDDDEASDKSYELEDIFNYVSEVIKKKK